MFSKLVMRIIQQYLLFMTLIDLNYEPILMLCVHELKYLVSKNSIKIVINFLGYDYGVVDLCSIV